MKQFPENFWWGAATSGPQSEGRFAKNTVICLIIGMISNLRLFIIT